MRRIFDEMNSPNSDLEPFADISQVSVGQIVAAEFNDEFYRARIISINRAQKHSQHTFTVCV